MTMCELIRLMPILRSTFKGSVLWSLNQNESVWFDTPWWNLFRLKRAIRNPGKVVCNGNEIQLQLWNYFLFTQHTQLNLVARHMVPGQISWSPRDGSDRNSRDQTIYDLINKLSCSGGQNNNPAFALSVFLPRNFIAIKDSMRPVMMLKVTILKTLVNILSSVLCLLLSYLFRD